MIGVPPVLAVELSVGSPTLNLTSNGALSLALFGATDFDVTRVDVSSVIFAGAHAFQNSVADVNGDGYLDVVLHFWRQDMDLLDQYRQLLALADQNADGQLDEGISSHHSVDAILSGKTLDGDLFEGLDTLDLFLSGQKFREMINQLASAGVI